jgi:hypothetical protein
MKNALIGMSARSTSLNPRLDVAFWPDFKMMHNGIDKRLGLTQ